MIKTHQEVGMANDGEDENRLRHRFLKKHHDVNFSKVQVLARKLFKFWKHVAAAWMLFKKLPLFIYLELIIFL